MCVCVCVCVLSAVIERRQQSVPLTYAHSNVVFVVTKLLLAVRGIEPLGMIAKSPCHKQSFVNLISQARVCVCDAEMQ